MCHLICAVLGFATGALNGISIGAYWLGNYERFEVKVLALGLGLIFAWAGYTF